MGVLTSLDRRKMDLFMALRAEFNFIFSSKRTLELVTGLDKLPSPHQEALLK